MTSNIVEEITPVLRAIAVLSPTTFLFKGEPVQVTPGPVQPLAGFPNHPVPQMPLIRDLQGQLYARCYMRRFEEQPLASNLQFISDPTFVSRLSLSNRSQHRWESGWTVYAVAQNGQLSLQKGDRQRMAIPGEYISTGAPGMLPQNGSIVTVVVPRESANAQPAFYFMYGETLSDVWDDYALLRFYFHATAECVPDLIEYLTDRLNRYQVPFRMKTLNEPAMYQRSDAVVLYLAKRYYDIATRIVRDLPDAIGGLLRSTTPLFTLPIQTGVGMAEDPNNGESFGMNRCRMVAEGIVDAWMKGDQSVGGRLSAIAARFAAGGFNFNLPYLSPGSTEVREVLAEVDFAYA
jgi:HopA1 effector protein family